MNPEQLASLRRLDAAHHLHPFTDHADLHRGGTHVMQAGSGCTVSDETGRPLLDALAGLWCVNVGYGRREIADAVHRQMLELCYYPSFFNTTTQPAILLADKIAAHAPAGMSKVFFSNSGSEANETALKLIRAYNKLRGLPAKTKILTRAFAYHGVTIATTSMTGLASCTQPFDLPLPGFVQVPGPHPYGAASSLSAGDYGKWCVEETQRVIDREGAGTIAALFAEPVQGAGGVIVPPPGHLRELRELCRRRDILFVADEVITGFGRLGAWFASGLWDLEPDLITMAKGITSGYLPLGATMPSDAIAEVLSGAGYLAHGFTYSGHPVSTAAGLANLQIIEDEHLVERVRSDVGPYFQRKLRALASHPAAGEIRGEGLIGAIDLLPEAGRAALKTPPVLGAAAAAMAREEGVIVRGIRDLIAMSPPLVITHEEIDFMFAAIARVMDRIGAV
ncbi:MAG: aminotransferase class III-fold pyridoxal phosphate-dependent enzyme [Deltaproteobacteria bacterium]|nr:aminotransferase class III-fold pyridoxal phosphate-dependent enzyme [Deltaproteobacteria bacterium]